MIKKLIRSMLTAQIFSVLTVSLCLLIDNIVIGQYLGMKAVAAYGLANPILLVIAALASALSAGVQVVCSKSLGRGSQEETNEGYSTALALVLIISVPFVLLVLIFRSGIARLLGAASDPVLFEDTRRYLSGFIIGAPATMGALILMPFLQMSGQNNRLIAAVVVMTLGDIGMDLLNALVFHGGMFGMGLASALSYYMAVIVGGSFFLTKKCFFKFSLNKVKKIKVKELFMGGIPTIVSLSTSVITVFVMNKLFLSIGGSSMVASFTIVSTIGGTMNCIATATGGVTLTLAGIFYHEEDRTGLYEMMRLITRYALILGCSSFLIIQLLAPQFVNLFIPEKGHALEVTVTALRIYASYILISALNAAIRNSYQGTGRVQLTEVLSAMEAAAAPILCAFLISALLPKTCLWAFFGAGEFLTLLLTFLYVYLKTRKNPLVSRNLLMLDEHYFVPSEMTMEANVVTVEDAVQVSEEAAVFCKEKGQNLKGANRIALCIEEMASNVVQHGFTKDEKDHHLSVRLLNKEDAWVIRFRDDCSAFDPVEYVPKREFGDKLGIGLVLKIADDVRYTYSMNLNNLTIQLDKDKIA